MNVEHKTIVSRCTFFKGLHNLFGFVRIFIQNWLQRVLTNKYLTITDCTISNEDIKRT